MRRQLILIVILSRIAGIILFSDFETSWSNVKNARWNDQFKLITKVNPDELLIAEVSLNYLQGKGFVSSNEITRPGHVYNETSLRPSYPVFIHILLMKTYQSVFSGVIEIRSDNTYFICYAILLHLVSVALFAFAAISFSTISAQFIASSAWRKIALALYLIYPSVFHFVGNLPCYESITLSILLIVFDQAMSIDLHNKGRIFYIAFVLILSTLIRPQLVVVYAFILFVLGLHLIVKKVDTKKFRLLLFYSVLLFALTSAPVLVKNFYLLGRSTLSTQTGFSFFEGHNPYARGSWCGDCQINPRQPTYQFIRTQVPTFDSLSEIEKSSALKAIAWKWIFNNPIGEVQLVFRKAAIFFLPYNSDSNSFNLLNFIVHLLSILSVIVCLANFFKGNRLEVTQQLLLLAPLFGTLALSEIFFVGYRWRYFAEPFMIILSVQFVELALKKIQREK